MPKTPAKSNKKAPNYSKVLSNVLDNIGRTRAGAYRVTSQKGMTKALKVARLAVMEIPTR